MRSMNISLWHTARSSASLVAAGGLIPGPPDRHDCLSARIAISASQAASRSSAPSFGRAVQFGQLRDLSDDPEGLSDRTNSLNATEEMCATIASLVRPN